MCAAWDPAWCCLQADPKLWETPEAREAATSAYRPYTAPTAKAPARPVLPSAGTTSALQKAAPEQQIMPQPSCPEHITAAAVKCPAVVPAVCLAAAPAVGSAPEPPSGWQCIPALWADPSSDSCATTRPGSAAAAKEVKTSFSKKKGIFKRSVFPHCTPDVPLQSSLVKLVCLTEAACLPAVFQTLAHSHGTLSCPAG